MILHGPKEHKNLQHLGACDWVTTNELNVPQSISYVLKKNLPSIQVDTLEKKPKQQTEANQLLNSKVLNDKYSSIKQGNVEIAETCCIWQQTHRTFMMLQLLVKHCVSTEIAQQHKCSLDYSTSDTVGLKKVKIKDRHRHIVGEIYKSPLFSF